MVSEIAVTIVAIGSMARPEASPHLRLRAYRDGTGGDGSPKLIRAQLLGCHRYVVGEGSGAIGSRGWGWWTVLTRWSRVAILRQLNE